MSKKIEFELNAVYLSILISADPFENYRVETLEKVFDEFKNDILDKLYKFSFYDLKEILTLPIPEEYSDSLKFNLILSLFLIKQKEEGIIKKLETLPQSEFEKIINFDFYQLANNEVQEDYQLIPVLFYFAALMRRMPIYPVEDSADFFKEKINPLLGAAGVSAVPMAARVVHKVGQEADKKNYLLMYAMGPNVAGVIGTVIAAGIFLTFLN